MKPEAEGEKREERETPQLRIEKLLRLKRHLGLDDEKTSAIEGKLASLMTRFSEERRKALERVAILREDIEWQKLYLEEFDEEALEQERRTLEGLERELEETERQLQTLQ